MNVKNIDIRLLKIVKSNPNISDIKLLIKEDILNNYEIRLLEKIINNYSIVGELSVENLLKEFNIPADELDSIEILSENELIKTIDELIIDRRKQQCSNIIDDVIELSNSGIYTPTSLKLLNNRYKANITIDDRDVLTDMMNYQDTEVGILNQSLSTGITYIDKTTNGLPIGKVSSIVSSNKENIHLFIINVVYNLLIDDKKVIYVSLNYRKEDIILDLVSKHSCNTKFKNKLSKYELRNKFDNKLYLGVLNDIEDNIRYQLMMYDENSFNMQNEWVLRRIFTIANDKLINSSSAGASIVIIEGLDQLHIETNRRIVTKKETILNDYYLFLKEMANDFVGTRTKIPILVGTGINERSVEFVENMHLINNSSLYAATTQLSSLVLAIYGDEETNKSKVSKLSVLKSHNDNNINQMIIHTDIDYWLINYDEDNEVKEDYENKLLKFKIEENENLKLENKELKDLNERLNEVINPKPIDDNIIDFSKLE